MCYSKELYDLLGKYRNNQDKIDTYNTPSTLRILNEQLHYGNNDHTTGINNKRPGFTYWILSQYSALPDRSCLQLLPPRPRFLPLESLPATPENHPLPKTRDSRFKNGWRNGTQSVLAEGCSTTERLM